jgi:hypothetical protein
MCVGVSVISFLVRLILMGRFDPEVVGVAVTLVGGGGDVCKVHAVSKNRVARFFLVHDTKTGKMNTKLPSEHKMYQMVIKYSKWS